MSARLALPVETITNPTTPTGMSNGVGKDAVPLSEVDIFVQGGDIRWTDDPTETITSSVGTILGDGKSMTYDGDFKNWKCIASGATVPTVRLHKYQRTTD